jgi:hypothetical protein
LTDIIVSKSPHNGKNITVQNIGDAVFAAVNWSKDFGLLPGADVFRALGGVDRIDLHDLFNRTAGIERPASLARPDDSEIRSPERIREVLADSEDPDYITAVTLAHSRNRLEDIAPLTPAQQGPAQGEAAFIMLLMMDGQVPAAGEAEIDYSTLKAVKDRTFAFLAEERLAEDLGWKPNERVVQFADLALMSAAIKAAQEAEE